MLMTRKRPLDAETNKHGGGGNCTRVAPVVNVLLTNNLRKHASNWRGYGRDDTTLNVSSCHHLTLT